MIWLLSFIRCYSDNEDFLKLIECLDADLNRINGNIQNEYNQFNRIYDISTAMIVTDNNLPVGCGCFKEYDNGTVEIKRIYVKPDHRRKGIAKHLVEQLEFWAGELGYSKAILETGIQQSEAICLYEKMGYLKIDNYGQYVNMQNSICFSKILFCTK